MTAFSTKVALLAIAMNFLAGCSSGSDDKKLIAPKLNYDTKSCVYTLNQGETANFGALYTKEPAKTYFGKVYNLALLKAVSSSSVLSSLDFINRTSVTVYKSSAVDTAGCSSDLFAGAKEMTPDVLGLWSEATSAIPEDSVLLGLYLPRMKTGSLPSLVDNAAIIIRQNTNRWTLVHEFMHHLFLLSAVETGYSDEVEKLEFDAAVQAMKDAKTAVEAGAAYLRIGKSLDSRMIHYTLEEMTIEATLKEAKRAGQLSYLPDNSNGYIASSAETATKSFQSLIDVGNSFIELMESDPATKELQNKIKDIQTTARLRIVETANLARKYPLDKSLTDSYTGVLTANENQHTGCAHEGESQRITSAMESLKSAKILNP